MLMTQETGTAEMLSLLESLYFNMRDAIAANKSGIVEFDNHDDNEIPVAVTIRGLTESGYANTKMFFGYVASE